MICSVLPLGALLSAEAASRISRSLSLEDSPACQRLLQRVIEAGIGLLARHVPFANSKKSLHGPALRSRSAMSMPWSGEVCDSAKGVADTNKTSRAQSEPRRTRTNYLSRVRRNWRTAIVDQT